MKTLITLLTTLILLSFNSLAQIQIGSGTVTGQSMPIEPFYGYTYSQSIFDQAEIAQSGNITKIYYHYNGFETYTDNIVVYMGLTSKTDFSSTTDWVSIGDLTEVYNGSFAVSNVAGWYEITLDVPFNYNNTDNLVICVDENTPGYHSNSSEFYNEAHADFKSISFYNDGTNPDPSSPPTGTRRNHRPNIKIDIESLDYDARVVSIEPDINVVHTVSTPVKVKFTNFGTEDLTSADIKWEVNGGGVSTYNWAGTLAAGNTSGWITVGNATFVSGANEIIAYTDATLNGSQADECAANDTSKATPEGCTAFEGVKYIGGASPDYATIVDAVTALNDLQEPCALTGAVTFKIRAGTYTGRISLEEIDGASATNTITFQADDGLDSTEVIIQDNASNAANNYVVRLDSTDYVTFNNLTIQIQDADDNYARAVVLQKGANNNTFTHCQIIGSTMNSSHVARYTIYGYGGATHQDNNNTFSYNLIKHGWYGVYFDGVSATDLESGNKFLHNKFEGQRNIAIFMKWQDAPEISNNSYTTTEDRDNYFFYGQYCDNGMKITNNYAKLHRGHAIRTYYCDGQSGQEILIANNEISIGYQNSTAYGIYSDGSNYINIYHNSINNVSTNTGTRAFYTTAGSNYNIKNNIFAVNKGTDVVYLNTGTAINSMDNNLFYSTAGDYLGYKQGASPDRGVYLRNWQTLTGMDANSGFANPKFTDDSTLTTTSLFVEDEGADLTAVVSTDKNGVARASTPCIGAYEFDVTRDCLPAGIYTLGPTDAFDFNGFQHAADSMEYVGIAGPITFDVQAHFYDEEQIIIPKVKRCGNYNDEIVFQSVSSTPSDVTLQYTATDITDNYIVRFDNAQFVTFKGMKLKALGTSFSRVVNINNRSNNITLRDNIIEGYDIASNDEKYTAIYGYKPGDSIKIINNTITEGSKGIRLLGVANTDYAPSFVLIDSNTINSQHYVAIQVGYMQRPNITNNNIYTNGSLYSTYYSVLLEYCDKDLKILNNKIKAREDYGIYLSYCDAELSGRGLIANNFIINGINDDGITHSAGAQYAIRSYQSTYQDFFHNSVNVLSTSTSITENVAFRVENGSNIRAKNNIFSNNGRGSAIYLSTPASSIEEMDYNGLFAKTRNFARWGSTACAYLESGSGTNNWQDVSSLDANSVFADPLFFAEDDLHTERIFFDKKGIAISGIAELNKDYDGETRNATPDFGADESTIFQSCLTGTKTINKTGSGPDNYTSFAAAVEALTKYKICGEVVFNVATDTYTEQFSIPELLRTAGNETARVIFQAASGDSSDVLIKYQGSLYKNYVVELKGADYITFQKMTIEATSNQYAHCINLEAHSDNNNFYNLHLKSRDFGNTDAAENKVLFYSADHMINEYTKIKHNYFQEGTVGIWINGSGAEAFDLTRGIEIDSNKFYNQSHYATRLEYLDAPLVRYNDVENTDGMFFYYTDGAMKVLNNNIYCNDGLNEYRYGVYTQYCDGDNSNRQLIANNTISLLGNVSREWVGVYNYYSDYQEVYHNSVLIRSVSSYINNGYCYRDYYAENNRVKNNNFANLGGGSEAFAMYFNGAIEEDGSFDNNNIYTNGTYLVYYGGNKQYLTDWQSTVSAKSCAANTINVFPNYYGDYDLHSSNIDIREAGSYIAGITEIDTDIDGDARTATTVSIGADEFGVNPNCMSGTYKIDKTKTTNFTGGASAVGNDNFMSFTAATSALEINGICDNVVFEVVANTYDEQVTLHNVSRENDPTHTITFRSESGNRDDVILTAASFLPTKNYTFQLYDADYVIIENMTIKARGNNYARVIDFFAGAERDTIRNCVLEGLDFNSTSAEFAVVYSNNQTLDEHNVITDNLIKHGSFGVWYGHGVTGGVTTLEDSIRITNNIFDDQAHMAIAVQYQNDITIDNNQIICEHDYTTYYGIWTNYSDGEQKIINNKIYIKNRGQSAVGIDINYSDANATDRGLIANNNISVGGTSSGNRTYYTIQIENSTYQNIYHNTGEVHPGPNWDDHNSFRYAHYGRTFYLSGGSNIVVKNNIFSNTGRSVVMFINSPSALAECDNNVLYSNGRIFIYWNTGSDKEINDLTEWKATGKGASSVFGKPWFSFDKTNYLRTSTIYAHSAGVGTDLSAIPELTTDLDGDVRTNPLCVGADYFTSTPSPLSGTKTIGGASPDYLNFTEAKQALYDNGINGDVIFNVRDGNYYEQLIFSTVLRSDPNQHITFQSESGDSTAVELSFASTLIDENFVVSYEAADHYTLKGITIKPTGNTYAIGIDIYGGSDDINILNNQIIGKNNINNNYAPIYSTRVTKDDNLKIKNNYITNGYYNINIEGYDVNNMSSGIEIENNTLLNGHYGAIYTYYLDAPIYNENYIYKDETGGRFYAIHAERNYNAMQITKNKIIDITKSNVGKIGIYTNYCNYSSVGYDEQIIANNFISLQSHGSTSGLYGIHPTYSYNQSYYHNSINLVPHGNPRTARGIYQAGGGSQLTFKNNIIKNLVHGTTTWWHSRAWAFYITEASAISDISYNSIYTLENDAAGIYNKVGVWNNSSSSKLTLADFEASDAKIHDNVKIDPLYASDIDLHIQEASLSVGTDLSGIVDEDIDAQDRTATPTIGADENANCLNGLYTINDATETNFPTGVNFNSFQNAVDSLKRYGMCGTVFFEANVGTYTEQINIPTIFKLDQADSIVFRPQTGEAVSITQNIATAADNYTIKIDGADRIFFEGFSIATTDADEGRVIEIANNSDNVYLYSNTVTGISNFNNTTDFALIYSDNETTDGLFIENNILEDGSYGVYATGVDASNLGENLKVLDNTLTNQYAEGINIEFFDSPNISANEISSSSAFASYKGIEVANATDRIRILANKIAAPTFYGIELSNNISTSANKALIANNFASVGGSTTAYAIYLNSVTYTQVYHNSTNITSTDATNGRALMTNAGTNIDIKNNSIVNSNGGYAIFVSSASAITASDYNNIWNNSGAFIGSWEAANKATFTDWQAAASQDANSLNENPSYTTNTDLHVGNANLKAAGTDLFATVSQDIDEQIRPVPPKIGADEVITPACADMQGIYTIGGSSPDYATFTDAVNDLIAQGICASVIFNVRAGTYNEQISIPHITGSGIGKTITFQSESGNNEDVVITHSAVAQADNYTIELDSTRQITFKDMTIKAEGTTQGTAIRFSDNPVSNNTIWNDSLTFSNNIIEGVQTSSTGDDLYVITNWDRQNGSDYGSVNNNITFENNTVKYGSIGLCLHGRTTGISALSSNMKIINNTFENQYYMGIRNYYHDSLDISYNTIYNDPNNKYSTWYAVYLYYVYDSVKTNNNNIYGENLSTGYGIAYHSSGSATNKISVANNVVNLNGTSTQHGIYLTTTSSADVLYNTVRIKTRQSHTQASYAYCQTGNTTDNMTVIKNNNFVNLSKGGFGYAIYVDAPVDIDTMDYNNLYTNGQMIGRWSNTTADNVYELAEWKTKTGMSNNSVSAYPYFTSETNLVPLSHYIDNEGAAISEITTDYNDNPRDASNPSIGAYEVSSANTCIAGGTYTIGGSSPSYATFTAAVEDMKLKGICGPVVFHVRDGNYLEQVIIPPIVGSSTTNTITFKSESNDSSKVLLYYPAPNTYENYTMQLTGADNIIIKNMTLKANNNSYARILDIRNHANNIKVQNNYFEGMLRTTASVDNNIVNIYSPQTNDNNIEITNNRIYNASKGVFIHSWQYDYADGIKVNNNVFAEEDANRVRKYINIARADSPEIIGDSLTTSPSNTPYRLISLSLCNNEFKVMKNKIYMPNGGTAGICINNTNNVSHTQSGLVANNFITIKGTTGTNGIYLGYDNESGEYSQGVATDVRIYNNSVNILNTSLNSTALYNYGNSTDLKVKNNIFSNTGGGFAVHYRVTTNSGFDTDYNDIFVTGQYIAKWGTFQCYEIDDVGSHPDNVGWRTKVSAYGALNTVSKDPKFTSETDLHINQADIDSAGVYFAEVSEDIDGESRDNPEVSMGADEAAIPITNSCMSGIYIIDKLLPTNFTNGASAPGNETFNTATEAVDALVNNGICDDVVFNIADGVYTEQLEIPVIDGTGPYPDINTPTDTNTVTFQSDSKDSTKVSIEFAANLNKNFTIQLWAADYIIFNQLTIKALNTGYGVAFDFRNHAHHVIVQNCELVGVSGTSIEVNMAVIRMGQGTTGSRDEDNIIRHSKIKNGSYGIYAKGETSTKLSNNNRIDSNQFIGQSYCGIYIEKQQNIKIRNNKITADDNVNTSTSFRGIAAGDGGTGQAYINEQFEISRNTIILNKGYYGIVLTSCNHTAHTDYGIVANNVISFGPNCHASANGIRLSYVGDTRFYHNSVNMEQVSTSSVALYIYNVSAKNNLIVKNNIFSNTGGGYVYNFYNNPSFSTNSFDYNDVYTTGEYFAYNRSVSPQYIYEFRDGGHSTTRTYNKGWQELTGFDMNSVSTDPLFTSFTDLTPKSSLLDDIGYNVILNDEANDATISAVDIDIAGATRTITAPSFGAIEYSVVGSCMAGAYTIGSSGDYTMPSEAIEALTKHGYCDNVVFNIANGTYQDQWNIKPLWSQTLGDSVIFQSAGLDKSLVTCTFAPNSDKPFVVNTDAADYITFNALTLQAGDPNNSKVIQINDHSHNINITNSKLIGLGTAINSIIYSPSTRDEDLYIFNNELKDGYRAIDINCLDTKVSEGLIIDNNQILDQSNSGIYLKELRSPKITNNLIQGNLTGKAMHFDFVIDNMLVSKNKIIATNATHGIHFESVNWKTHTEEFDVINNFITAKDYGMEINGYSTSSYGTRDYNIFHNSVNVVGASTSSRALRLHGEHDGGRIINNIFANTGGNGHAVYIGRYYKNDIEEIDYNLYYTEGDYVGYIYNKNSNPGRAKPDSASYLHATSGFQTLSSTTLGEDLNSLFRRNPSYTSSSDLHLALDTVVFGRDLTADFAALGYAYDDIDGEARTMNHDTACVGADEFIPACYWDGSESSVWTDPDNWTPAIVPGELDDVLIPYADPNKFPFYVYAPIVDAGVAAEMKNFTTYEGSSITINVNALNIGSFDVYGNMKILGSVIYNSPDYMTLHGNGTDTLKIEMTNNDFARVKFESTAKYEQASNLDLKDVSFVAGSEFYSDGFDIRISGSFLNNSADFSITNAEVEFNGTGDTVDVKTSGADFYDMRMNGSAGIKMLDSINITNNLMLNSGVIYSKGNVITVDNASGSAVSGTYSNSSYIEGKLCNTIGTDNFEYDFPVGKSTSTNRYHLVQFGNNNLTGVSSVCFEFIDTARHDNTVFEARSLDFDGSLLKLLSRYGMWKSDITGSVTGGNYGVKAWVINHDMGGLEDNEFCVMKRNDGGSEMDWVIPASFPTADNPGRTVSSRHAYGYNYTAFSEFGVGLSEMPLPIELIDFSAKLVNEKVELKWITASEINNDYFTIERSADGTNFKAIKDIDGAGNSNQIISYNTTDEEPLQGISYYRLKQTDFDGTSDYSEIEKVINIRGNEEEAIVKVYPNPFVEELKLEYIGDKEQKAIIYLVDANSKIVFKENIKLDAGFNIKTMQLANLSAGMYLFVIQTEDGKITKRVVKVD